MIAPAYSPLTLVQSNRPLVNPEPADSLWQRLREEAEAAMAHAPLLSTLFLDSVLNRPSFERALAHRVAHRLKSDLVGAPLLFEAFQRALLADPTIAEACRADIIAIQERDAATQRLLEPFLYFKGFHAITAHRLAHWLWRTGEREFAFYLQSQSSAVFQTDIHPAARIGRGIFLDHATGLVVGETAVIEDDVSILQDVTLGGTGKETGDRHPKIRRGAMIGAGAKILGNIEVGACARVAAGSVVLQAVDPHTTVAGVPAKLVRTATPAQPAQCMDQILSEAAYIAFDYTI